MPPILWMCSLSSRVSHLILSLDSPNSMQVQKQSLGSPPSWPECYRPDYHSLHLATLFTLSYVNHDLNCISQFRLMPKRGYYFGKGAGAVECLLLPISAKWRQTVGMMHGFFQWKCISHHAQKRERERESGGDWGCPSRTCTSTDCRSFLWWKPSQGWNSHPSGCCTRWENIRRETLQRRGALAKGQMLRLAVPWVMDSVQRAIFFLRCPFCEMTL